MSERIFIGLGSNLGDRLGNLKEAVRRLGESGLGTEWTFSALYETAPVGPGVQENYYNAVATCLTTLTPRHCLTVCLEVEEAMGRVRTERWAARNIDLDLLAYGAAAVEEDGLIVPHPHILERNFVLAPLCDLDRDLRVRDTSIAERLRELGEAGLCRVAETGWQQ